MTELTNKKRLKRNDACESIPDRRDDFGFQNNQSQSKSSNLLLDQYQSKPVKKFTESDFQPQAISISDLSRVQVRQTNPQEQSQTKKRNINETTLSSQARQAPGLKFKKGYSDDEFVSCQNQSYNSEEDAAFQSKNENDFNENGPKGELNEETYYSVGTHNRNNAQDDSEDEPDPYDQLPKGSAQDGNWRHNKESDEYHLKDWFRLPAQQYHSLFQHQREGVNWLYDLYTNKLGGVLGDDMGLGKTVQVATLLKGLFDSEQIRKVLIVVPATMKVYWQTELNKWCSGVENVMQFDDKKRADRLAQIKVLKKKGGILVTSYGMVTGEKINLSEIRFDLVVVDEGHRAKNINTELRKNLVNLRVKGIRLSLSGTPIQNNLSELWSVFDFVQPKIFGSFSNFQIKFTEPIEKGLLKGATPMEQQKSDQLSSRLREMYKTHFLRRTKDNIFTIRCAENLGRPLKLSELPLKTDLVIWLPLTTMQQKIYQYLIEKNEKDVLSDNGNKKDAFFVLSYIKKLCLHPQLLSASSMEKKRYLGLLSPEEEAVLQAQDEIQANEVKDWTSRTRRQNANNKQVEIRKVPEVQKVQIREKNVEMEKETCKANSKQNSKSNSLFDKFKLRELFQEIEIADNQKFFEKTVQFSSKIMFVLELMKNLREEGHRVLIFSMSKKILNILESIILSGVLGLHNGKPIKHMRIDGDTEISSREQICIDFNNDPSVFCGLLTTKVGGFGLNLTGADRAIILDPDWNPANDNQAVDRVFRIGQKRDVIVYRLLTIGTIEEKIYRRQIYKKGMSLATIDNGGSSNQDFDKYFGSTDLFELFRFNPNETTCETMELLLKRDGFPVVKTPTNDRHISFLRSMPLVGGLSLNSNLYSNNESTLMVQEPTVFIPVPKKQTVLERVEEEAQSKRRLVRQDQQEVKSQTENQILAQDYERKSQVSFKFQSPLQPEAQQGFTACATVSNIPIALNSRTQRLVFAENTPKLAQVVAGNRKPVSDADLLFSGVADQDQPQTNTHPIKQSQFGFSGDALFQRYSFTKN